MYAHISNIIILHKLPIFFKMSHVPIKNGIALKIGKISKSAPFFLNKYISFIWRPKGMVRMYDEIVSTGRLPSIDQSIM